MKRTLQIEIEKIENGFVISMSAIWHEKSCEHSQDLLHKKYFEFLDNLVITLSAPEFREFRESFKGDSKCSS